MRTILTLALAFAAFEAAAIQPVNMDRAVQAPPAEAPLTCSMQKEPVTGRLQNVCLTAGQRAAAAANAEAMANDKRTGNARPTPAMHPGTAGGPDRLVSCQNAGCSR